MKKHKISATITTIIVSIAAASAIIYLIGVYLSWSWDWVDAIPKDENIRAALLCFSTPLITFLAIRLWIYYNEH